MYEVKTTTAAPFMKYQQKLTRSPLSELSAFPQTR